jgi:hypothetical protein
MPTVRCSDLYQVTDRYKISPGETRQLIEAYGKSDKTLRGAIYEAERRTRYFFFIATWEATWTEDGGILVKRTRAKTERTN